MKSNLWLGSQTAYEVVLEAQANALAKYGDREDSYAPELLNVQGNVGIIDVSGSLINGNAGFMSYFGVTGYGDIRDALVAAVQNPDVSAIMLNIDSGGGAVAGVHETAQLIARVDKIKPVVSYTGGHEASAALWLGSSARHSFTAETAISGSLGILMVHADKSKQLEDDGIKVTMIRAGSEKALNNPYEPLTKEAKAALQAQADTMYDIFLGHVATQRGLSNTAADAKFGQGRLFIGKQAVDAGLIDAVGTLEDAYGKAMTLGAKIATKKGTAKTPTVLKASVSPLLSANMSEVLGDTLALATASGDNLASPQGTNMTTPLTLEQLAAMAAGVTLEAVVTKTPEELAAEAAAEAAATAEAATAAEALAATEAAAAAPVAPDLTALEAQVKELQAELLTVKAEAKTATDSLEASAANLTALAEIARNSVKTMTVALGGKAEAVDAMAAADIVAEHGRVSTLFKAKFKVGGVASPSNTSGTKQVAAILDPRLAAIASKLPSGKR